MTPTCSGVIYCKYEPPSLCYTLHMDHILRGQKGFTAAAGLLAILVLVVIGVVGYTIYHNHKTVSMGNTVKASSDTSSTLIQKYLTISAWGVRVPY